MRDRRRITVMMEAAVYDSTDRLRRRLGFRSMGEMVAALLGVLEKYVEINEQRQRMREDEDEITEMFNRLGNWERTPDGVVPKRKHRRDVKG